MRVGKMRLVCCAMTVLMALGIGVVTAGDKPKKSEKPKVDGKTKPKPAVEMVLSKSAYTPGEIVSAKVVTKDAIHVLEDGGEWTVDKWINGRWVAFYHSVSAACGNTREKRNGLPVFAHIFGEAPMYYRRGPGALVWSWNQLFASDTKNISGYMEKHHGGKRENESYHKVTVLHYVYKPAPAGRYRINFKYLVAAPKRHFINRSPDEKVVSKEFVILDPKKAAKDVLKPIGYSVVVRSVPAPKK